METHAAYLTQLNAYLYSTRADQITGRVLLEFPAMHGKSRVTSAMKYDFFELDNSGNCIIRKT